MVSAENFTVEPVADGQTENYVEQPKNDHERRANDDEQNDE
jgi:hypothetical protein